MAADRSEELRALDAQVGLLLGFYWSFSPNEGRACIRAGDGLVKAGWVNWNFGLYGPEERMDRVPSREERFSDWDTTCSLMTEDRYTTIARGLPHYSTTGDGLLVMLEWVRGRFHSSWVGPAGSGEAGDGSPWAAGIYTSPVQSVSIVRYGATPGEALARAILAVTTK